MVSLDGRRGRKPGRPAEPADSRTQSAADPEAWARTSGSDTLILLHVRPGAKSSAIQGVHGARLKICVRAPAVEGQANAALIEFLAESLRRPRRQLRLESGATSREKTVRIEAVSRAEVVSAIRALLRSGSL